MARILIVDAERLERMVLGMLLERTGHEVYFATDGQQAHEIYMGVGIDIVVADLCLPKVTGLDLFAALRGWFPGVPIIVTSGVGLHQLAEAKREGAFEAFSKPVDPHEVLKAITMAAPETPGWRAASHGA